MEYTYIKHIYIMCAIYMYVYKEITKSAYIEITGVSYPRGWALSPLACVPQQFQ